MALAGAATHLSRCRGEARRSSAIAATASKIIDQFEGPRHVADDGCRSRLFITGAVWRFDVREVNLDSADLTIELHARDDDAWSPEHVIVWGISGRVGDERVIPLAAFLDLAARDAGGWRRLDQHRHHGRRARALRAVRRARAEFDARAPGHRRCSRRIRMARCFPRRSDRPTSFQAGHRVVAQAPGRWCRTAVPRLQVARATAAGRSRPR